MLRDTAGSCEGERVNSVKRSPNPLDTGSQDEEGCNRQAFVCIPDELEIFLMPKVEVGEEGAEGEDCWGEEEANDLPLLEPVGWDVSGIRSLVLTVLTASDS
jgi:hypothetical protein